MSSPKSSQYWARKPAPPANSNTSWSSPRGHLGSSRLTHIWMCGYHRSAQERIFLFLFHWPIINLSFALRSPSENKREQNDRKDRTIAIQSLMCSEPAEKKSKIKEMSPKASQSNIFHDQIFFAFSGNPF